MKSKVEPAMFACIPGSPLQAPRSQLAPLVAFSRISQLKVRWLACRQLTRSTNHTSFLVNVRSPELSGPEANLVKCLSWPLLQICKSGLGSNLIGPVLKYACHYPIAAPNSPGHESLRVRKEKVFRTKHDTPDLPVLSLLPYTYFLMLP